MLERFVFCFFLCYIRNDFFIKQDFFCFPGKVSEVAISYYIPKLFLAPMEGVADRAFRMSCAKFFPQFDEATTEFIRLPRGGHIPSLISVYDPHELSPLPLAAQVMTHCAEGAGQIARALEARGAPRIELNCGCPSNTVVGRGAGSALLEDPHYLQKILLSMRAAISGVFSVKMRLGYKDRARFEENLDIIAACGVDHVTIHPRTKIEGYSLPCHWDQLEVARKRLTMPIVGSGEIKNCADAWAMTQLLQSDCIPTPYQNMGLMVGRAALGKPWIFAQIKRFFIAKALQEGLLSVQGQKKLLVDLNATEDALSIDKAMQWLEHLYVIWQIKLVSSKQRVRRIKQQINSLFDPRLYAHIGSVHSCIPSTPPLGERLHERVETLRKSLLRDQSEEAQLFLRVKTHWKEILMASGELFI